jgi:hypothetical protein
MAIITKKYTLGWYGGCDCESVMVSQFENVNTRGKLTFISPDFSGSTYYFARVSSSLDRLSCGKFYIVSNESGTDVDVPDFHIISTDGRSISECCDISVPTPPTIIAPQSTANVASVNVPENTTPVTTIVASGDSPITYSMEELDDSAKFNLNSTTGELTFKSPPDFETPTDGNGDNVYVVKVIATNDMGTDELTLNVNVIDVDDIITIPIPPTIILPANGGSTALISVPENTTDVSVVVATGDSPITYSIDSYGDSDKFDVDSTSGKLTFKTAPDFENPTDSASPANDNTYMVRVSATNATGNDSIEIHVNVTNVGDGVLNCPIDGNVEDSCLEVTINDGYWTDPAWQKLTGIYEYNPNDVVGNYTDDDLFSPDNSKPHWIKADGTGSEIFFIYAQDLPHNDNYTDVGYWIFRGLAGAGSAQAWSVGYGPAESMGVPAYPWCKMPPQHPTVGGTTDLFTGFSIEQVECPVDEEIPCCDGFQYTHTQSTEDDPTQTGEQYGNVELQKSVNPFYDDFPQWNISTLCHNGATGGVPARSPIDIRSLQDYFGMTDFPYKHGEIALGAEYTGEMRITLINGDCYHACVDPEVDEILFVPRSEPLNCGGSS